MEEFLEQYGYLALSAGTFLEGETAIMVASSLVYSGFFKGPYTVIFAFLGSFVSDWLYFTIGRLNGRLFIERRPKLRDKFLPLQNFFAKNQMQILFSYRFLYGFRVLIPLMIGMSNIKTLHYLGYSIVAGLFWATTVSLVGYAAGAYFDLTPQSFEQNVFFVILGFGLFGMVIGYSVKRFMEKEIGG